MRPLDAEKLELARSHYVDGIPWKRIANQYHVSDTLVRIWCEPYREQFREEILEQWEKREERIRSAVLARMEGASIYEVTLQYQISDYLLNRAVAKVLQDGIAATFTKKPVFDEKNSHFDAEKEALQLKKQNRKPWFGLRNKVTGRWVQQLTAGGNMRIRLFSSKSAARAYRAKCGVCAEVYEADLFGWS